MKIIPPISLVGWLVIGLLYVVWTWSSQLAGFGGDNATYLFMAQHYSPFHDSDIAKYFTSISQYPPLYPLLLAFLGAAKTILWAHLITTSLFIAGFVLLNYWLYLLKLDSLSRIICVLLYVLAPGTYMEAMYLHSESMYLLFSIGALALTVRLDNDKRADWLWKVAILVSLASLTRAAGISLIAAFVFYVLLIRPRRMWLCICIVTLPFAFWMLVSQHSEDYLGSLQRGQLIDSTEYILAHLSTQAITIAKEWNRYFVYSYPNPSFTLWLSNIVVWGFSILCLIGLLQRLNKFDGLYSLFYLLLITIWPFPAEASRLLLPIVPVLLGQGFLFLKSLGLGKLIKSPNRILVVVSFILVVGIIILPSFIVNTLKFAESVPHELSQYKRSPRWYVNDPVTAYKNILSDKIFHQSLTDVAHRVPSDSCIYSIKPSIIALHTKRISRPLKRVALAKINPKAYFTEFECEYIYFVAFRSPSFPSMYPLKTLRKKGVPIKVENIYRISTADDSPIVGVLGSFSKLR